jgi:Fic family protein
MGDERAKSIEFVTICNRRRDNQESGVTVSCMAGQTSTSGYRERNSTADKALDILGMFTESRPTVGAAEVAEQLQVARSTAYRYVQSLVNSGFLEEADVGRLDRYLPRA